MKVIKGLVLFCFSSVVISSCFDAPEFSDTPEIFYDKIQFKEVPGVEINDSLILYLDFRDGDGDLGLDPDQVEVPYNPAFYYLAPGGGDTTRVVTTQVYDTEGKPYFLLVTDGATGKLVTNRTRSEPGYGYLPPYDFGDCSFYADAEVLVPAENVDATYNIVDTLTNGVDFFYLIQGEPLLYKANVYHNNIEISFWVLENGDYVEFDWLEEYCIKFDGRFPVLPSKGGPLEGTIRYAMPSNGFLSTFSIKTLKVSARIRDRALHLSDSIVTQSFTLDGIRVNP